MDTGVSTAPAAETHWSTRTELYPPEPDFSYLPRLAKFTCAWSWGICAITPATPMKIPGRC